MKKELMTAKALKHTIFALLAYFITYVLSSIVILSILTTNLGEAISQLFTSFPMMFTGNLLPSALGYGAIFLCNKTIEDELLITRSRFFTLLAIVATEVIGTIVYYAHVGNFVSSSFAIITWLIIDTVRTNKKYKKLKSQATEVEIAANDNDIENDLLTAEVLQEEAATERLSLFEETETFSDTTKEDPKVETTKENKLMNLITSKRIAAVISIVLCAVLYLSFLSAFTTKRDTYICYTTKTGECFHSATCNYLNTAYETTVYEASQKYKACKYCNPCIEQYKTTITDRNYIIPILISVPISAAVFVLLAYKKKK